MYNVIRIEADGTTIKNLANKEGLELNENSIQETTTGIYRATFHADDEVLIDLQNDGIGYFVYMTSQEVEDNIDEMYKPDPV